MTQPTSGGGMTYTPGPWQAGNGYQDSIFSQVRPDGGLNPIGFVYCPAFAERSEVGRRALADTQLIAAAPTMLEALQDARAAIASLPEDALGFGGSGPQPNTPDDPGDSVSWPIQAELLHKIDAAISRATLGRG